MTYFCGEKGIRTTETRKEKGRIYKRNLRMIFVKLAAWVFDFSTRQKLYVIAREASLRKTSLSLLI